MVIPLEWLDLSYLQNDPNALTQAYSWCGCTGVSRVDYRKNIDVYTKFDILSISTLVSNEYTRNVYDSCTEAIDSLFDYMLPTNEFYAVSKDIDNINKLINSSCVPIEIVLNLYNRKISPHTTVDYYSGYFGNDFQSHTKLTISYDPTTPIDVLFMKRMLKRINRRTNNKNRLNNKLLFKKISDDEILKSERFKMSDYDG